MMRWPMAIAGLFLCAFAVVALSGPGDIDSPDGAVRYEVARSFVEHGDVDIPDPKIEWMVLPGRGGRRYSEYRLPQSVLGVVAILAADATGPVSEPRRQFFFSLTSAVAGAVLAITYALHFRRQGLRPRSAPLWAAGGVFCTQSWYYATSSFDDILGSAAVVLAVTLALGCRPTHPLAGAVAAGLALGLSFNCKQPLGIFVLPVMAALYDPDGSWKSQWSRLTAIAAGMAVGLVVYEGYIWYKFPPGSTAGHAELLAKQFPTWSQDPAFALAALLISPAAGAFFYNPALWICVLGLRARHRSRRLFYSSLWAAIAVFVLFICSLTFFKGDTAWGPRYLTPIFAVLWIMAPDGSRVMRRPAVATLLVAGLLVQIGALSIHPCRLHLKRGLPCDYFISIPILYFHPEMSHLLNRPREIVEVLAAGDRRPVYYDPPYRPRFPWITWVLPDGKVYSGEASEDGPPDVTDTYRAWWSDRGSMVIDSLRPWWASLRRLDARGRPVDIERTVALFLLLAASGLILMIPAAWGDRPLDTAPGDTLEDGCSDIPPGSLTCSS